MNPVPMPLGAGTGLPVLYRFSSEGVNMSEFDQVAYPAEYAAHDAAAYTGSLHTKWSVLQGRLARLEADAAALRAELDGMARTPFDQRCAGCGTLLDTEADFAAHFVVDDLRYLNLGACPVALLRRLHEERAVLVAEGGDVTDVDAEIARVSA